MADENTTRDGPPGEAHDLHATFQAYVDAQNAATEAFVGFKHGEASEAEVDRLERAERTASDAHVAAMRAAVGAIAQPPESKTGPDVVPESVHLDLTVRDARFAVEHLRFLADRERAVTPEHAAANLSARWLADQIEAAIPSGKTS